MNLSINTGEMKVALQYLANAKKRCEPAHRQSASWRETTKLLAANASARIEVTIRFLLYTPSHRLRTVYNFYGGKSDYCGTIVVSEDRRCIISLGEASIDSRADEDHDYLAVLARWTHMQGWLTIKESDAEIGAMAILKAVHATTLDPYFSTVASRPPMRTESYRFWRLVDLEYLEYFFYFLQVGDCQALHTRPRYVVWKR